MLKVLAPVGALLTSVTILLAGNGLQTTLLPLRAGLEVFSPFAISLMGSSYFLGFVAGCLFTSHLVRRVGHIRTFAAVVAAASAVPLLHLLLVDVLAWPVLRAITGFCMAALFLVIESWLNERAANHTRGTVFAAYTTLNFGAITAGQLLITLYDPAQFSLFAIASVLVSLAAIPVALTTSAAPAPLSEVRLRPLRLLELSPVGVAGCLVIGLAGGSFWSLGPVFAVAVGLEVREVAIFMSVTVVGGALSQWPFGRLSDRLDRRVVIAAVALLSAATGVALFLATGGWPPAILPLAFAFGAFSFPLYALSVAHVNDVIGDESFVEVAGGLLLVNGLAAVVGPLVAVTVMNLQGAGGLFLFTACVHAGLVLFTLVRMRVHSLPAETHGADFVPVARNVTASPLALDPRAGKAAAEDE